MTVADDRSKEVNAGVALLLERMKTHPEEFTPEYDGGVTKWGSIIGHYKTYLTKEDNKILDDAWKETVVTAMQEKFTQAVLEELVNPKSEKRESPTQYTSTIPLGGQITAASSAQQAMQLQAAQAQHQAHINAHQQALGALGVNSATQSIGYGAGAKNLLQNIFGGNK